MTSLEPSQLWDSDTGAQELKLLASSVSTALNLANWPPFKLQLVSEAAVNWHIAQANPCRNAASLMGYSEMPIQIQAVDVMTGGTGGDVMTGGTGGAGSVLLIHHQEPGSCAGT